jgi:hypothetical protein
MENLITTYLLQKSSVSIPGLGTIYVERSPARSDFINKQLLPPSYHFRFDKYFDAPGKDFFNYLAARKNIEDYEAIKLYNEWALTLRNNIGSEPSTIRGIGLLKRDLSGEVVFEPETPLDSTSIAVPAQRIVRTNAKHTMLVGDKEVSNVEMTDYLHEEVHKEKTSWWIYALIIAAVALTAILFHYFKGSNVTPFGNHQTIESK